jgi:hypothetical protein
MYNEILFFVAKGLLENDGIFSSRFQCSNKIVIPFYCNSGFGSALNDFFALTLHCHRSQSLAWRYQDSQMLHKLTTQNM